MQSTEHIYVIRPRNDEYVTWGDEYEDTEVFLSLVRPVSAVLDGVNVEWSDFACDYIGGTYCERDTSTPVTSWGRIKSRVMGD